MPSDGTLYKFAVSSVKEAFIEAKVGNIRFDRVDEVEYDQPKK